MNILQVNASARSYANNAGSFSTRLANELVQKLLEENPGAKLTVRDLTQTPHPILDETARSAFCTGCLDEAMEVKTVVTART